MVCVSLGTGRVPRCQETRLFLLVNKGTSAEPVQPAGKACAGSTKASLAGRLETGPSGQRAAACTRCTDPALCSCLLSPCRRDAIAAYAPVPHTSLNKARPHGNPSWHNLSGCFSPAAPFHSRGTKGSDQLLGRPLAKKKASATLRTTVWNRRMC